MKQKKEEWRDLPGYEGCYQISNLGRIKSLERHYWYPGNSRVPAGWHKVHEKILKQHINSNGYCAVCISKGGKHKPCEVQILVAMAWLGYKTQKGALTVNHINAIPTDNRLENLEVVTVRENNLHALRMGRIKVGFDNANTIVSREQGEEIVRLKFEENLSDEQIAQKMGLKRHHVRSVFKFIGLQGEQTDVLRSGKRRGFNNWNSKYTEEEVKEMARLKIEERMSYDNIAKLYNTCGGQIRKLLIRVGHDPASLSLKNGMLLLGTAHFHSKLTLEQERQVIELRKQGMSVKDLSKRFEVCETTIANKLRPVGLMRQWKRKVL